MAFVDLRDASGVVQVVIHDEAVAHPLRSEFCLRVTGTVTRRPEGNDGSRSGYSNRCQNGRGRCYR